MNRTSFLVLVFFLGSISLDVHASCGSASCSLVTHFDTLGMNTSSGWQIDLRYEYIKQDQLRSGTHKAAKEFVNGEHTEIYTRNNNLVAILDYSPDEHWGISLQLPYVQREHYHIFDDAGTLEDETWNFHSPGDARLIGRYLLGTDPANKIQTGVQLGLKLPTGRTDETNTMGEEAERSLQPGTGTTDLIAGYFRSEDMILFGFSGRGFMQLEAQSAVNEHDGYRAGNQFRLNSGLVVQPTDNVSPILQVNLLIKGRDHGSNAEPDDSGGEYLWISPGLSKRLGHQGRIYGFVQLPLYQHVNGVQLTADWNASVGLNWHL